jgi:hypothetical protein
MTQNLIDRDARTSHDDFCYRRSFRGGNLGIRETLNRNSAIAVTAIVCAIAFCAVVIAVELRGNNGKPPTENYYTTDDGKTWFVDSATKPPPFDHDGGKAVRCFVFKGPNGKFAGLLEKYSDEIRAQLASKGDQLAPFGTPILVKKPGETDWKQTSVEREALILVKIVGPTGSGIERVMP